MNQDLPKSVVKALDEYLKKLGIYSEPKFHVSAGTKNGDSFSGDVFRVIITIPDDKTNINFINKNKNEDKIKLAKKFQQKINLIVKVAPKNEVRRQLYNSTKHFEREKYIYEIILPSFKKFQNNYICYTDQFLNYPTLIKASADLYNEFIILNDLNTVGFRNFDRPTPLDFKQCSIVMENLAKFHGISYAMKDLNKNLFDDLTQNLSETIFIEPIDEFFDKFLHKKINYALSTLDNLDDEIVKLKLIEFGNSFSKSMIECVNNKEDAVICHGDCWISNIMFRKKVDIETYDICFLDWQVSRYCSPVIDISYFIFCCTDVKLRCRLSELLFIYHNKLMKTLNELGCFGENIFPFNKLMSHMKKYSKFGLGMALMTLHTTTCKSNEMPNVIESLDKFDFSNIDEITIGLIKRPAYRERMAGVCRDLVRLGYL